MSLIEQRDDRISQPSAQPQLELQTLPVVISPDRYRAVILDMDGVVTRTAVIHAAAWKQIFDEFLASWAQKNGDGKSGQTVQPFDVHTDYHRYVDGKARHDGVRSFLAARGIRLPEGRPDDSPEADTVFGLGKRKDRAFLSLLEQQGVETFASTIRFIHALKNVGIAVAVISASRNATMVLKAAGILELFDAKVDGVDAERLQLRGKPEPDIFLEAARQLKSDPQHSVVIEDALPGVQAGDAGNFALVIGVNRDNQEVLLKGNGADVVVDDLEQVEVSEWGGISLELPNPWLLTYEHYDPEQEGLRETLCTLGNGYFCTRGAMLGSHDDGIHYPGTYLAGGYNRLVSTVQGQRVENEDLVNFPNWLVLTFRIENGDWFDLDQVEILSFSQTLDLHRGVLERRIRFRDAHGRQTRLNERRLVHMESFHLAALELTVVPEDWAGQLEIRTALDGTVVNNNVFHFRGLSNHHLEPLETSFLDARTMLLKVQTNQSEIRMAQAARTVIVKNGVEVTDDREPIERRGWIGQACPVTVAAGDEVVVEKVMALYTSQDHAISEPGLEARKAIMRAPGFEDLLASHTKAWDHLWMRFDIVIDTEGEEMCELPALILRLQAFHLLETASPNSVDRDTNIPARGWHGEGYRGHIFWDNLFVFPFFNFRMSDITESLLKYRYRRLGEARELARASGFKGALFPWQSGSNGEEETPPLVYHSTLKRWLPDYTHMQIHVNAAVAYDIWEYYQVSGDIDFLFSYGAEMMIEIARFWASVATYNPALERYEIKGVVGPDEYHQFYPGRSMPGVDNNAYTNVMAVWCLLRALETLEVLPEDHRKELTDLLGLQNEEMAHWDTLSRRMRVDFLEEGIISQFEGYEHLEEFPWQEYRASFGGDLRHMDDFVANHMSLDHYQISKQADVLMLFYLFSAETLRELFGHMGYEFPPEAIPKTIDYYTRRTIHGSSLSRVANAWVLARANRKRSWKLFREALLHDVSSHNGGSTSEGIHLGAMGGTLDLMQRCYTGMELREDILWFNPVLPRALRRMAFSVHYRANMLKIAITHEQLEIEVSECRAKNIQVGYRDQSYVMYAGESRRIPLLHAG
ncbi:MAG TPA: beta-phosphoglucomutase family hydrolase [Coleofasciculaceae cyanobacterium]|jgi:beta-phosphoglucomutase family hydrolase